MRRTEYTPGDFSYSACQTALAHSTTQGGELNAGRQHCLLQQGNLVRQQKKMDQSATQCGFIFLIANLLFTVKIGEKKMPLPAFSLLEDIWNYIYSFRDLSPLLTHFLHSDTEDSVLIDRY